MEYVATDIYLPSLPALSDYFHASDNEVQMTLFSYLISFSIAQCLVQLEQAKSDPKVYCQMLVGTVAGAVLGKLSSSSATSLIAGFCMGATDNVANWTEAYGLAGGIGLGHLLVSRENGSNEMLKNMGLAFMGAMAGQALQTWVDDDMMPI